MAGETLGEAIQRLDRSGSLKGDLAQTDAQLLERCARQRDEPAFAALVARHGPMILGLCHRLLHDARDAEDAFQATFLILTRKVSVLPRPTLLGPWLYGVAWRVALRLRGRIVRRRVHEQTGVDLEALPTDAAGLVGGAFGCAGRGAAAAREISDGGGPLLPGREVERGSRRPVAPAGWYSQEPVGAVRDLLRSRLSRRGLALSVGLLTAALTVRSAQALAGPLAVQPEPPSAPPAEDSFRAAARLAADDRLVGGAGGRAAKLARGVLRTTAVTKLVCAAVAGLAVCLLAVVVALWGRSGSRPAAIAEPTDAEAIQGVWQVTAVDDKGLDGPLDPDTMGLLLKSRWRFTADALIIHNAESETKPIPYKLDATSRPKAMSVQQPDGPCMAVYDLNDDALTIRLAAPLHPVPLDDLTPRNGDGTMGFVFHREK